MIYREIGDRWALAYLLEDMGGLAALQEQADHALRLVGAAAALREAIGSPLSIAEKNKLEALLAPARQALAEAAQEAALNAGHALSLTQAIEYALDRA